MENQRCQSYPYVKNDNGTISFPEGMLEDFRNKLDASGMPTLVAGVQEQLDAWIAENGLQTSESAASSDTAPMTGEQKNGIKTVKIQTGGCVTSRRGRLSSAVQLNCLSRQYACRNNDVFIFYGLSVYETFKLPAGIEG